MADKKIKDSSLSLELQKSKSYTIKTLWGIPKTFYKILKALNKSNKNQDLGYEIHMDFSQDDLEEQSQSISTLGNISTQ